MVNRPKKFYAAMAGYAEHAEPSSFDWSMLEVVSGGVDTRNNNWGATHTHTHRDMMRYVNITGVDSIDTLRSDAD